MASEASRQLKESNSDVFVVISWHCVDVDLGPRNVANSLAITLDWNIGDVGLKTVFGKTLVIALGGLR